MYLRVSQWYDFAVSIERGPLVYAQIEEYIKTKDKDKYKAFQEIFPSKWNYSLYFEDIENVASSFVKSLIGMDLIHGI